MATVLDAAERRHVSKLHEGHPFAQLNPTAPGFGPIASVGSPSETSLFSEYHGSVPIGPAGFTRHGFLPSYASRIRADLGPGWQSATVHPPPE